MLRVGRGPPRIGTAQVETGGPYPEPGRYMLGGQFRMGSVPASLFLHPAMRATNSLAGTVRRFLSGFGFDIVLGWRVMGE